MYWYCTLEQKRHIRRLGVCCKIICYLNTDKFSYSLTVFKNTIVGHIRFKYNTNANLTKCQKKNGFNV